MRLSKIKLAVGILIALCLLLPYSISADLDTDDDGLSDYDEINIYHTNPYLADSDYDGYDDKMESTGISKSGEQMPAYIQFPGNHPLVSAYPKIEVEVDDTYIIFTNKEISFETRTVETFEHTYGTITTKTTTSSVGEGGSHTTNNHQDIINRQKDIEFESSHANRLISDTSYYSQKDTFGKERVSVKDVGGSVTAGAKMVGPVPTAGVEAEAHASYTDTNTITEDSLSFNSRGQSIEVDEGGSETKTRIFEEIEKSGSGKSDTIHSSITRTTEKSVSKVDLYTIGSSQEWAEINTQDTSNWGAVRVSFGLRNTGTAPATNINNLRLRVKIGDYVKTFPPLDMSGIEPNDLPPGEYVYYPGALEIPLRLEEIKAIDSGIPIKITIIDFDYDQKLTAYGAFSKGTLIQIDECYSESSSCIAEYLVPVNAEETYSDILKKINYTAFIQNEPVKLIDFQAKEGYLYSLNENSVTEWSWWTANSEGIENKTFLEKEAKRGSKILLTYHKDSDRDFYTDREEIKRGRDLNDKDDYPSPKLSATPYLLKNDSGEISIILKLENSGDYNAYGIEARLYASNKSVQVIDEFAGGSVRVKEGEVLILTDTLSYKGTSPRIEVLYNDPQGPHRFIVPFGSKLENFTSLVEPVSRDLSYSYNGCVLPESSGIAWIPIGDTSTNYMHENLLVIDDNTPSAKNGYSLSIDTEKVPTDFKISARLKIEFTEHPVEFRVNGKGGQNIALRIQLTNDNELIAGIKNQPEAVIPNPTDFHVYAINYDAQTGTYALYIDQLEKLSGEVEIESITGIKFGSLAGSSITKSIWDSVNFEFSAGDYYDSYELKPEDMIKNLNLISNAPSEISYTNSENFGFVFSNPDTLIENGNLYLSYFLEEELLISKEIKLNYSTGSTSYQDSINPSDFGDSTAGKEILFIAVATDYQGVMLAEDTSVLKVKSPIQILDSTSEEEKEMNENESFEFFINAVSDEGIISYQWSLDGENISDEIGSIYIYKSDFNSSGTHSVSVEVSDGSFTEEKHWTVFVNDVNRPPVIETIPNISIYETENVTVIPVVYDPDGDNLTVNISEPIGNDGFWQTSIGDKSNYTIVVSAYDGFETIFENFTLTVLESNSTDDEDDSEDEEDDSDEDENDSDEDEGNNNGNSNQNTFTGGGSGGGSSTSAELNTADSSDSSETEESSSNNQVQIEELPQQAAFQTGTAPTGLSIGINNRIKATGVLIACLVAIFLYTVFDKKPNKSGPFKQAF